MTTWVSQHRIPVSAEMPPQAHLCRRDTQQTTRSAYSVEADCTEQALAQCSDLSVESAFVPCCLVLVNKALASHVIKYRNCVLVGCFSSTLVTTCNGRKHTLYHGAHHRALACVALTRFFGLAYAFARLGCVGHKLSSGLTILNSAAHYPPLDCPRQQLIA